MLRGGPEGRAGVRRRRARAGRGGQAGAGDQGRPHRRRRPRRALAHRARWRARRGCSPRRCATRAASRCRRRASSSTAPGRCSAAPAAAAGASRCWPTAAGTACSPPTCSPTPASSSPPLAAETAARVQPHLPLTAGRRTRSTWPARARPTSTSFARITDALVDDPSVDARALHRLLRRLRELLAPRRPSRSWRSPPRIAELRDASGKPLLVQSMQVPSRPPGDPGAGRARGAAPTSASRAPSAASTPSSPRVAAPVRDARAGAGRPPVVPRRRIPRRASCWRPPASRSPTAAWPSTTPRPGRSRPASARRWR